MTYDCVEHTYTHIQTHGNQKTNRINTISPFKFCFSHIFPPTTSLCVFFLISNESGNGIYRMENIPVDHFDNDCHLLD